MSKMVDYLTYKSWYYQIFWYGMSFENARKLYKDALLYEKIYKKQEKKKCQPN